MKKIVIVLSVIFIITASFYFWPKPSKEENTIQTPKAGINISKIIEDNLGKEYQTYNMTNNYTIAYNESKSIIVENNSGQLKNLQDIFTTDNQNKFQEIMNNQINIKYPKFIATPLTNGVGENKLTFNHDGLLIEFTNYQITPAIEEKLNVTLTCKMLKGIVDINCEEQNNDNYNYPKLDPNKPTIALTFDDGPNNNTKTVINALLDNHAEATFFMLGRSMYTYQSVVQLVHNSGMEIGSHTYDHQYLTKITAEERAKEVDDTNAIYNSITGDTIKLIRAPYGSSTEEIRKEINLSFIQWSVDTEDWRLRNTEKVADYVINNVHDGDIVLLHDIHATTANAVGVFLPELYAKGIQVTTVSKLAELKGYSLTPGLLYRNFKK